MDDIKKSVTIVMPHYNEAKFVNKAIPYLADLGYQILIIDNNSEDSSVRNGKMLEKQYSNVMFVPRLSRTPRPQSSYERCAFLPETPYILFMRCRDLVSEYYIEHLVSRLEENPDAGLACSPLYKMDSNGIVYAEVKPPIPGNFLNDHPLVRALEFIDGLYFTPFWALYRRNVLQECYRFHVENGSYMGCDLVVMLYCALMYKWVYRDDVQYIVRDKFDKAEMLKGGTYFNHYYEAYGLSENEKKYPYHRLGNEILKVMDAFQYDDDFEKLSYIKKIKESFTNRCMKNSFPSPF